ncbi:MAG TPA: DUF4214 domain-containing protein [Acidimicrobiales bacterium]|nr:DUF4214 domain-containing protein [Acidimicrobiales bacterium]
MLDVIGPTAPVAQAADHYLAYDLGPLQDPARITGRDAGASGLVGDQSLWAYGDTMFPLGAPDDDGAPMLHNTGATNLPSYYRLSEDLDSTGVPDHDLIPYHPTMEAPFNQGSMGRFAIWPSSVIPRGGTASGLVYYKRAYFQAGTNALAPGSEQVGLATVNPGATTAYRVTPPDAPLFGPDECQWGIPFLDPTDGYIYFYAVLDDRPQCPDANAGGFNFPTGVARIPLSTPGTRSAVRFWDGDSWTQDQNATAPLSNFNPLGGSPSVMYNAHLDKYLAITELDNQAGFVLGDSPVGPWTGFDASPGNFDPFVDIEPSDTDERAFRLHPELGSSDGSVVVMSYYREDFVRNTGYSPPFDKEYEGQIRLVAVDLRTDALDQLRDYVSRTYQAAVGWTPGTTDRNYWADQLRNRNKTVPDLIAALRTANATAVTNIRKGTVREAYQAVLDRSASADEQTYWAGWLATGGRSYDNLAGALVNSGEFRDDHPAASTIVPQVYLRFLGRTVDTSAYNYWVNQLNTGATSVPNFVIAIIRSQEGTRYQATLAYDAVLGRAPNTTERNVVAADFVPVLGRVPSAVRSAIVATAQAGI